MEVLLQFTITVPRCFLDMTASRSLLVLALVLGGCTWGPDQFDAPEVDPAAAAAESMTLYDEDQDGLLSEDELKGCPAMLSKLAAYDANADGSISREEVERRLAALFQHGTGGTQLNCLVTFKGRPLADADLVLEPEPYLGSGVQAAHGKTNGSGAAQMGIPAEYLPSHLRRLKAVHYGAYKVRVTHPTIAIPEKYNSKTELGYETEIGNPFLRLELQ